VKNKLIPCLTLALLLTGCHGIGTQKFTALAPAQTNELENSSLIVLDVVPKIKTLKPDYNLHENLSMLAPQPKYYKADVTLTVGRVVKGDFKEKTIELHDLREPTEEQSGLLGIQPESFLDFTNRTPLRIGFDGIYGEQLKNLKIMFRP
jgi:hypothetical protein